jgi:integrase
LQETSIYESLLTLGHFERLIGPDSSKRINQNTLDEFVLDRGSEVKKITLNKDIRNLNAFLHWAVKNRFIAPGLEIKKVKVAQKPVIALTTQQVQALLSATAAYPTLRLRVLLAVTTGLRRGDIGPVVGARGRYGWAGPDWTDWFYKHGGGALFDLGVYNLTTLTGWLGPVRRVTAMTGVAVPQRTVSGQSVRVEAEDNAQVLLDFSGHAASS